MTPKATGSAGAAEAAAAVAARHAAAADAAARAPVEAIGALREVGLLAACAPAAWGGPGLDVRSMVAVARTLAAACGSTAMIWSMHQGQLACLCRHATGDTLVGLAREAVARQWLIASVTSEATTGGDIRSSTAAVQARGTGDEAYLDKRATAVSYGDVADLYLITARSAADVAPNDQVLVAVPREQARLTRTSDWRPLGMRATTSAGYRIEADIHRGQVFAEPFGDIAASTMVPLTQTLWAAAWNGLCAEALRRAVRAARRNLAGRPTAAPPRALGEARWRLAMLDALVDDMAGRTQSWLDGDTGAGVGFNVRVNALKVGASEMALEVAQLALTALGVGGYAEEGQSSVARIIRDLHSARIMIGNERLVGLIGQQMLMERRER